MTEHILYGAGAAGRYALKHMQERGEQVVAFVDSDPNKHLGTMDRLPIMAPDAAKAAYPDAVWVATAISRPAAPEIREAISALGVKTRPLWECLDVQHGLPPDAARHSVFDLLFDRHSKDEFVDQLAFRGYPRYKLQRAPSPISEIYFPPFIRKLDDESFCDVGAADGDTVTAFRERWEKWSFINAIEPDRENYKKLRAKHGDHAWISLWWNAVSDADGQLPFTSTGDYSAHLGGKGNPVYVHRLDDMNLRLPPTYIKMDIEGSELEALWGARRIMAEHKPVLAICAYHKSADLWQIPLLIHALQPDYKLFLRRYAEGAFEVVWYAVPSERVL